MVVAGEAGSEAGLVTFGKAGLSVTFAGVMGDGKMMLPLIAGEVAAVAFVVVFSGVAVTAGVPGAVVVPPTTMVVAAAPVYQGARPRV